MTLIELKDWFYNNLDKNWQLVLKRNIFNWFNEEEEEKIENNSYKLSDSELCNIYFLNSLSTIIPDPYGSEGYTPYLDFSVLKDLKHVQHLDISNGANFSYFPNLHRIISLRCTFSELNNLSLIKYFPNIESLDCSNNPIKDISAIFDFKLIEFFIDENTQIAKDLSRYKKENTFCSFINPQSGTTPYSFYSFDNSQGVIPSNRKSTFQNFQKEIIERGIEHLIHFTPTINLFSILESNELMSRAKLENLDIEQFDILDYVQFMDDVRHDDKRYINLSLSCPNAFLFSRFRQKTKDNITINWCVLKICPKHIYDSETLFSVTNAASNVAKNIGITGDFQKFQMLFANNIPIPYGIRKNISAKYPTNVQAEILVKNTIPSESIISVCFESEEEMAEAKAAMSSFNTSKFIVDKEIFSPNRTI